MTMALTDEFQRVKKPIVTLSKIFSIYTINLLFFNKYLLIFVLYY
jgi:hypothetical protein